MALDIPGLAKKMLDAALPILKDKAPEVGIHAEGEFQKIAITLGTIEKGVLAGQITQPQASLLVDMQKSAARSVLLASEGLSLLAVEAALNAALKVVKEAVNTALGFVLL